MIGCGTSMHPLSSARVAKVTRNHPPRPRRKCDLRPYGHAAAAASLILLSACASKPAIEVRTVRVEVPVPVACVAAADVPVRPAPLPPRPEDARQALDLAVAWVLKWQGYGEKADAVLRGCKESESRLP